MNYNTNDYVVVNGTKYYRDGGETDRRKPKSEPQFDINNMSKKDRDYLIKELSKKGRDFQQLYNPRVFQDRMNEFVSYLPDGETFSSPKQIVDFYDAYNNEIKPYENTKIADFIGRQKRHVNGVRVGTENKTPEQIKYDLFRNAEDYDRAANYIQSFFNDAATQANNGAELIRPSENSPVALYYNKALDRHIPVHYVNGTYYSETDPRITKKALEWNNNYIPNESDNGSFVFDKRNFPYIEGNIQMNKIQGPEQAKQPYQNELYNNKGEKISSDVNGEMYRYIDTDGGPQMYIKESDLNNIKHAYGGRTSRRLYAAGGSMGMIPMGEQEDYNMVGAGGSHEQNPMGGVPYGMNADGSQNMVEQGETSVGNQVYSDRSSLSPELCQQLGLPEGTSPSQAMQQIEALYEQGQISDEEYQEIQNIIFQDQEMQKQNSGASYQQGGVGGPGVPQNEGIQPDMVGAGGQQFAYGGFRGFRF